MSTTPSSPTCTRPPAACCSRAAMRALACPAWRPWHADARWRRSETRAWPRWSTAWASWWQTATQTPLAGRQPLYLATPSAPTAERSQEGHVAGDAVAHARDAARPIARPVEARLVVINRPTAPPLTGDMVSRVIGTRNPTHRVDVVSTPEFLREGSAIQDFM